MLIVCPSCATSYDVEPASLQPNGRQVRCVRCRTVWRAELTPAVQLIAAAAALAPDPPPPPPRFQREPEVGDTAPVQEPVGDWSVDAVDTQPAEEPSFELPGEPPEPVAGAWSGDFVELPESFEQEAPPIAPVDLDAGRPPIAVEVDHPVPVASSHRADIETFAARFGPRPSKPLRQRWPMSRLQTAILIMVIVDAILIGWRKDIVRAMPQTASFYAMFGLEVNLRGLAFTDVTSSIEEHEGVPILVVQGNIVNEAGTAVGVPRLKLAVRNAAKEEIYSWTAAPPRESLSPGLAVGFRSRLASPPPDSRDVLIRFVTRSDVTADMR
jgi:predicted Zn finger-like uncharacterized protein